MYIFFHLILYVYIFICIYFFMYFYMYIFFHLILYVYIFSSDFLVLKRILQKRNRILFQSRPKTNSRKMFFTSANKLLNEKMKPFLFVLQNISWELNN